MGGKKCNCLYLQIGLIVFVENPESTTKQQQKLSSFGKIIGYKVNIKKLITFLYANYERVEFEIKNNYHLYLSLPKVEVLS